jgi:tRNA 2-selenouridine synthase
MSSPQRIPASVVAQALRPGSAPGGARWDAVLDARSPAEFAEDALPGAQSWPVLDNEQRARVGTLHKSDAFAARTLGAALVARNIAAHLESRLVGIGREWRPLVYCWRGGQRSGSLATVLAEIGFRVGVLDGGYRAFRREVLAALEDAGAGLAFTVIAGTTGSGKSRLLAALAAAGAQVLDLEGLACHRGSVLGALPDRPQPSQKAFETALWQALAAFDPAQPVFVESESRMVGRLRLPLALVERMRAAPCVQLELPLAARVQLLIEDYAHLAADPVPLVQALTALKAVRGTQQVQAWQALAERGATGQLVEELLVTHYDPIYRRSMAGHFTRYGDAPVLHAADASAPALAALARQLLEGRP